MAPEMRELVVRMGHARNPGHGTRNERGFCLFWFYSLVNPLVYKLVDFSLCFNLKFSQVTSPGEVLLTNREKGQVTNSCRFYTSSLLKVL